MKKKGKIIGIILIVILILMCIVSLILYSLPLTKNYITKLGYAIEVPFFSKIEDKKDHIEENGTNEIINIKSYQEYNADDMGKMLVKGLKKYETENEVYYYNEKDNYTISIDEKNNRKIEFRIFAYDRYKVVTEDEAFEKNPMRFEFGYPLIKIDESGLVNVYENIYKYNLSKIQFTYSFPNGGTYRQNLKDIFQYKYYSIDEFISFYDSLVKINYGEKEETNDYTLYKPKRRDIPRYIEIDYSILICNNKYIFGDKDLEYDEKICE